MLVGTQRDRFSADFQSLLKPFGNPQMLDHLIEHASAVRVLLKQRSEDIARLARPAKPPVFDRHLEPGLPCVGKASGCLLKRQQRQIVLSLVAEDAAALQQGRQ